MNTRPPTARDLAALAGVSQTTVSLALRNHPRISPATRERIKKLALEHGYNRDPLVSTLMTRLRATRRRRDSEKIALLTWWNAPDDWRKTPHGRIQYDGMRARAARLGYEVEEHWAGEPRMTSTRMSAILQTRAIRGVILLSKLQPRGRVLLDWKHFAIAATSYTIIRNDVHRATHNYAQGMTRALRELRHLGYSRIGYINKLDNEERVHDAWLSAYAGWHYLHHGAIPVPPLLVREIEPLALRFWLERHRPQAVLGSNLEILEKIRALGWRVPEDVGFAALDCLPGIDATAGIDQLRAAVGARAIELVAEQLENNDYGLPVYPKTVMIDGAWHEGPTVRRLR
ncbi:MAG: LacI family transcriptional regulator [Opitutaceae bacterium]|jgi:LacI family transcriptional regulator|nr:LacI family transcriptional regulator [Opitutaceae bacterium]